VFLRIAYLTAVRKLFVLGVASLVALGARIAVLCGSISDHIATLADTSGTDVQQSGQARDE
jgi:trans-2-enoyl-CoA reductase